MNRKYVHKRIRKKVKICSKSKTPLKFFKYRYGVSKFSECNYTSCCSHNSATCIYSGYHLFVQLKHDGKQECVVDIVRELYFGSSTASPQGSVVFLPGNWEYTNSKRVIVHPLYALCSYSSACACVFECISINTQLPFFIAMACSSIESVMSICLSDRYRSIFARLIFAFTLTRSVRNPVCVCLCVRACVCLCV
jgi:hypothetical protein